jgi:hypothetical protein
MLPEVTLGLAIYDYLPILIWVIGSYFLIDTLRKEFTEVLFYYVLILGLVSVFLAGTLKATWKLLIALNGTNFSILSDVQFPIMGVGFFLLFISLLSLLLHKKKNQEGQIAVAILLKKISLPLMMVGSVFSTICLLIIARRRRAVGSLISFALFLIVSTAMGYVGSLIIADSYKVIFFEQTVNCFSTLLWTMGSYFLWKAPLRTRTVA